MDDRNVPWPVVTDYYHVISSVLDVLTDRFGDLTVALCRLFHPIYKNFQNRTIVANTE
jgi:hypothetical protein